MLRGMLIATVLAATASPALYAQGSVIYRCTDASGALTVQNAPCAKGMKQEMRTMGALPSLPPPSGNIAAPVSNAPPAGAAFELVVGPHVDALPASTIPEAERKPPPALFQCQTWDEDVYLSEHGDPEPECAPLTTVGIGGNANMGAGAACEMRRTECTAIAAEGLCPAWRRRVGEAEFRWKFARAEDGDPRKVEYQRVAQALADSNCNR